MSHCFNTSPVILSGKGAFEKCPDYISSLGKRVLIVTGKSAMQEQGFISRLTLMLRKNNLETSIYEGVSPEPEVGEVDKAREKALDCKADIVIGIGGGSSLDVAKSVAGLLKESAPAKDFLHGKKNISGTGIPFVGIPSTFGTGSEVTPNAVLSDHEAKAKKSIRHESLLARVAVVDPELGKNAPEKVKAESGMDALTQAIESFLSIHSTPITESLSFGAVALIASSLEDYVYSNSNIEAAENCASGSLMAGMALANARLGAVHGLAHPLGIHTGIQHGKICGILLPYVLLYNRDSARQQYELLSGVVGGDVAMFSKSLLAKLGMPDNLSEAGLSDEGIALIASESLPSGSLKANPRQATEEDLRIILNEACRKPVKQDS